MLALLLYAASLQSESHSHLHPSDADIFIEVPGLSDLRKPYEATALARLATDPVIGDLLRGAGVATDDAAAGGIEAGNWISSTIENAIEAAPLPEELRGGILTVWRGVKATSFSLSGLDGTLARRSENAIRVGETFAGLASLRGALDLHASAERWGSPPDSLDELVDLSDEVRSDAWGHPWFYERTGDETYRLLSLGADGVLGGSGAARDVGLEGGMEPAISHASLGGVRARLVLEFADEDSVSAGLQLLQSAGAEPAVEAVNPEGRAIWRLPIEANPEPSVFVERQDLALIVDVGLDALPRVSTETSLASLGTYGSARSQLKAAGTTVWQGYSKLNLAEWISMLPEEELDFDREPVIALVGELFGTTATTWVWRTGLGEDGRFSKESFSASAGSSAWLKHQPVSAEVRGWIPADTTGFYSASMNAGHVLDRTLDAAAASTGIARADLLSMAEAAIGAPVEEQLIESLGESFAVCFDLAGLGPPKVRAYAELADPDAFREAFGGLWDAAAAMVDKDDAKLTRRSYRKVELFTLSPGGGGIGIPQPTFAILGNRLFFTLSSSHAKKEVKRLSAEVDPALHPALGDARLAGSHSLLFMDWGALIGGVYELAKTFGSMFGVWETVGIDAASLPEAASITAPFQPTIGYSTPVNGGLYAARESSVGPEVVLAPVLGVFGYFVAMPGVVPDQDWTEAVSAPIDVSVEDAADTPAVQTRAVLRGLKTDLKIYQLHHDAFPESLEALLAPSSDFPDGIVSGGMLPSDGWGRALGYTRDAAGYILYSHGPDGLDQGGAGDDIVLD